MSIIILFEPELVTINSIPYSLCPCTDCRGALTLGITRCKRSRQSQPAPATRSRCCRFTTYRRPQTDGADDEEEEEEEEQKFPSHQTHQRLQASPQDSRPKVRFLPPSLLRAASQLTLRGSQFSFADPFSETRLLQRRESDGSDISSLVGSPAFSSHRDTLARLHKVPKPEVHSDDEDSAYTTATSAIFQRPGLYRHRDTLARLHFQRNQAVALPAEILVKIGGYLDCMDFKNLRLTCRHWTEGLPQPRHGVANRLPNEIIHQILELLSPIDCDAARHVCRSWFSAGLDYKIAANMLRSSGNYPAYLLDLDLEQQKLQHQTFNMGAVESNTTDCESNAIDQEWLMSKRLATEARLSAAWRGSGIRAGSGHSLSNFSVVNVFDFRRLFSLNNAQKPENFKIQNCTVSACGIYLLLIVDCEILVYSLYDTMSPIAPVVRIVACRRVLAVSMDTSSGRYSVAALLEGRLGCSWDLKSVLKSSSYMSQVGEPMDLGMRTDIQGLTSLGVSRPIPMRSLSQDPTQLSAPVTPHSFLDAEEGETIESLHGIVPYRTDSPDTMSDWVDGEYDKDEDLQHLLDSIKSSHGPVEIITRPTGLYANLGTSSDCPRSVAICPQRKCVAFGCRTGIELHWIDHATATKLNRWFPLAAPSDFLYFLPQRQGADTTKKLRLISSSAGSTHVQATRRESAPAKWKIRSGHPRHGRLQSMTRLFFGSLPFPNALSRTNSVGDDHERQGILRTVDCDHYRAVPISDGAHVLFTDPTTGLLCLGSDAPLGGPTKLMRKVCMVPPKNSITDSTNLICYRAGSELRWGVRVVAAYDDGRIVLYNMPVDCFEKIRSVRSSIDIWDELAGVVAQSDLLMDVFISDQQDANTNDDNETPDLTRQISNSSAASKGFRSLQIDGAMIYHTESKIDDIQVDCDAGGVKVWIFLRDLGGVRLDIYAPRNFEPVKGYIGVDGLPHLAEEEPEPGFASPEIEVEESKGKQRASLRWGSEDDTVEEEIPRPIRFVVYE